jgi:transcriptional regulator with XRE-family HTH domain
MDSEALVQLALETLTCSQKELALRLGVSPTQISKWKKGDHMSRDMDEKFRDIVGIGQKFPEFVMWAGSVEAADKWEKLIKHLAEIAECGEETGYNTEPLSDELELLCLQTFMTLREMGVDLPNAFPEELNFDYDEAEDSWKAIDGNPYSHLIQRIYKALTNVYGFYAAYVVDLIYDDGLKLHDIACKIDSGLLDLAATKLDDEDLNGLAPNFREFQRHVKSDYVKWLNTVKKEAFRASVPLRAELLDMVSKTDDSLGQEAESEWASALGFNSSPLHPDIYMNELLVGMRAIHQVLPAIMKKLGIDEEFKIDKSELQIS